MLLHALLLFFQNPFLYTSDAKILSHLKCPIQMLSSPRSRSDFLRHLSFSQLKGLSVCLCLCLSLLYPLLFALLTVPSTNLVLYLHKYLHFLVYLKLFRDRNCVLLISVCSIVFKNTIQVL